jgi:hypothetical protein
VFVAVMCVASVAGCAAHETQAQTPGSSALSTVRSSTQSTRDAGTRYGAAAATLAAQVPGCTAPDKLTAHAALDAAPALRPVSAGLAGASSVARCALRGAGVLVFAFTSRTVELTAANAVYQVESYFSGGAGWIAVPTSTRTQLADQSVVQAVAQVLGGQLYTGRAYRSQP